MAAVRTRRDKSPLVLYIVNLIDSYKGVFSSSFFPLMSKLFIQYIARHVNNFIIYIYSRALLFFEGFWFSVLAMKGTLQIDLFNRPSVISGLFFIIS